MAEYTIVRSRSGKQTGIRHTACGRTSWNANDVANRYCGACHIFIEDVTGARRLTEEDRMYRALADADGAADRRLVLAFLDGDAPWSEEVGRAMARATFGMAAEIYQLRVRLGLTRETEDDFIKRRGRLS